MKYSLGKFSCFTNSVEVIVGQQIQDVGNALLVSRVLSCAQGDVKKHLCFSIISLLYYIACMRASVN